MTQRALQRKHGLHRYKQRGAKNARINTSDRTTASHNVHWTSHETK